MQATILKIHPAKLSHNGQTSFIRVEFTLEDGAWAKTDLVPMYRNYKGWKDKLVVGAVLWNLRLKRVGEIDADSSPVMLKPLTQTKEVK